VEWFQRPLVKANAKGRTYNRRRDDESGDTLVEVLIALVVIGIAGIALIAGFATSISSSAEHRSLATLDTLLKSYAETAVYQIQQQPNPLYANCPSSYTLSPSFTVPSGDSGYTALPITSIQYWDSATSSFTTNVANCVAGAPEMLTVSATGPASTQESLNFIVDDPGFVAPPGPLSVTTTSLPSAEDGQTGYSQTLAATGGSMPYVWSLASGTPPSGLSLSSSGVISGNVSRSAASSTFTVEVTDAIGATATKALTITVNAGPSITTTSLATADDGQTGYSQTLAATGGSTPYTWSLASGTLPSGLSLSSSGVISGNVSSSAASSTFTVEVTDALGVTTTKSFTLTVKSALSVTTTSLPGATKGVGYSQTLAATGGSTPYTWSIASGSLPSGLTLSSSGVISGTPTKSKSSTFTVEVTDANGVTATQSLTIT
jgi:Tfp pilus assembly protein PilV